ncbi:MAG: PD40 domain-containing protein [Armatimonadetes bacterium]|nr:PD40 domain-containing protein [Armatimonadota bacterium]
MKGSIVNRVVLGVFTAVCIACGGAGGGTAGGVLGQGDGHYDGARMVFVAANILDHDTDIYAVDADGDYVVLAQDAAKEREPALSPDGTKVVYASLQSGTYDLYLKSASDPTAAAVQLTSGAESDEFPTWSPDGTMIAFTRRSVGSPGIEHIYRINVDGTGLVQLTAGEGYDPKFSPDGTQIYYGSFSGGSGSGDLFVMNSDGTNQTQLTSTPTTNDYLPVIEGNKIIFIAEDVLDPVGVGNKIMCCDLNGSNVQLYHGGTGAFVDFPAFFNGQLFVTDGAKIYFYHSPSSDVQGLYLNPFYISPDLEFSDGSFAGG